MKTTPLYYHRLTYWQNGRQAKKVIGSKAINIDEANQERCAIAKKYHPNTIIALSTHNTK